MKATFIIFLTLCVFEVMGQSSYTDKFINNFYEGRDTVMYFQTIDEFTITQLEKIFSRNTLTGVFEESNKIFILTESERKLINKELHQFKEHNYWSRELFKKIKGIPVDSKLNNESLGRQSISFFNAPIFLRGKTFCFFYNGYKCGSKCGKGEFILYKRKNNKWLPYITLYRWIA